jgi:hypothetical protein
MSIRDVVCTWERREYGEIEGVSWDEITHLSLKK